MRRFADQPLGAAPCIVILGTPKLGNLVVLTPLLRALKQRYPASQLLYRGSERTRALEAACPWIDGPWPEHAKQAATIDLLINADAHNPESAALTATLRPRYVVGPAEGLPAGDHPLQRLAVDRLWAQPDLVERYPDWIHSGSIRELHCRVCWQSATDAEQVDLAWTAPPGTVPDVLLAVNGERRAKLWPERHWLALLPLLEERLQISREQIGLVGAPPPVGGVALETALIQAGVQDRRGVWSLTQLVGAYRQCKLAICVDSGPLHLAAAAGCPTVAIFGTDAEGIGASPERLWAPRHPLVVTTTSPVRCTGCLQEGYRNDGCVMPRHDCLEMIEPRQVIDLITALALP